MLKPIELVIQKNDNVHNHYRYNNTYYKEFVEFIEKIKKVYSAFSDSISEILSKKYIFFDDNTSIFYSLMIYLKNHIQTESSEYKELSNHLTNEIIEKYKIMKANNEKTEGNLTKDYIEASKKLKKAKSKFDEYQNLFLTKMKDTEKLIYQEKSIKINEQTSQEIKEKNLIVSEAVQNSKKIEAKYKNYFKEVNSLVEEINGLENKLANFYKEAEENLLNRIQQNAYFLLATIKTTNFKINYDIEEINKKILDKKYGNEIKSVLESNKFNLSNLKKLEFKPYAPTSSLKNSIKSSAQLKEMNINYDVITYLQDYFKDICPDLDMEEEKRRKKLRTLCAKIFEENQNYGKEDQNELLKFMHKDDYRNYFISALTKQRINGKYKREEKVFYELLEIMKYILDLAEKENNYDNARNCIILSQTFFFEKNVNGKIEKLYLMEFIKDNKWLAKSQFWKEFIEDEIIRDKLKFEEELKLKDNKKNKGDVTKIYFGKLITYSHNMNMFGITKEEAFEIINYFMNKYEISKDMKDTVIVNLEAAYSENKEDKKGETSEKIENINNTKSENESGIIDNNIEKGLVVNINSIDNCENKNEIKNENNNILNNEIKNGNNNEIKNEVNNNENNNKNIDNNAKIEDKKEKENENVKDDNKDNEKKDNKSKDEEEKIIGDDWVIEGDGYGF